jgi:hypothetical protein
MKKTALALILAFALYIPLAVGVQSVNVAKANPIDIPSVPAIQISYPLSSIGGYVNSTVEFEIYVNLFIESPILNNVSYSLDGEPSVDLEDLEVASHIDYGPDKIDFKTYKANIVLADLSEGSHTVVAYARGMSVSRNFTVNSHYQVTALKVLSPTSQTYSESVPLMFTVNGEIEKAHYYLYKGHESVFEKSLSGNTTLDNLSEGSYDLYLFVTTEYGQASEAVHFSMSNASYVENLQIIIGGTALLVFSVAIGLLVYFKKRRKEAAPA